ncbi:MAG: transglycosylase SLT domain-containing protein [Acidobacteriota bacterium]|nr:transglycosylase SLT domain-containing protein [Acidobacteriota bacterium]
MKGNKTLIHKVFQPLNSQTFFSFVLISLVFLIVPFNVSCQTPLVSRMTEEQALQAIRQLTKGGKLPPESVVADFDSRFANTRAGALAKLLRGRIRLENGDAGGAAEILNSNVFAQKTNLGDYALWLRGKALLQAQRPSEAMNVFQQLAAEFPNSLRIREAKLLWTEAALQSGLAQNVPNFLQDLIDKKDAGAFLAVARAYEQQQNQAQAINFYRRAYFHGTGSEAGKQAESKLSELAQNLTPQTAEEAISRAEKLYDAKKYAEASAAYTNALASFPNLSTPQTNLRRLTALANLRRGAEAQGAFNLIPDSSREKEEAYYQLARAYAGVRQWQQARTATDEMRRKFPSGNWTPKTLIAVGMAARDAKNKLEETYFLRSAVASYPNAVDVASAQFELAWLEHESDNFPVSSQMMTEHLARYADKDTTNRGKAGYWAARDSERAGKINEACALYEAVKHRYDANWYGYQATQRIANLRSQGRCASPQNFAKDSLVGRAVANLKTVTVAAETATERENERLVRADQLGVVGLFDWAFEEVSDAGRTAPNSPKVNLTLAKHYRLREDNVTALRSLARSYPDYPQMFPEEMGREEWDIFYPLTNWQLIKNWAQARQLDPYQVAGLIRQESVFNPRAKSHADAYGLMQLLIPTARATARKYGNTTPITGEALFQPALNIELGTAYMRDQFDKFGRIEYVAIAYNAGPGRVAPWRASLPLEMDEFVEEIPFSETKGYVQGVIRNTAQYRRLYDENGNFRTNVGTKPIRNVLDSQTRERIAEELPEINVDDSSGQAAEE